MTQQAKLGKVGAQKQVSSADSWSFAELREQGVWGEDTENSKSEIFEKISGIFRKISGNFQKI